MTIKGVVPRGERFSLFYRHNRYPYTFNSHEKRKRFKVLLKHPFGRNRHWGNHYLYKPEEYPAKYGIAKSLHAANARLVRGLPQRLLDTSQMYPVEAVEDDIRHSIWQLASQVDEPLCFENMTKQQTFLQYLFPTVFQHLWRLPHTAYSRSSHLSYEPRLETFFSRWGQNSQIRTTSGMLLRNSVPIKPYAVGEEIPRVLSGALKPCHDFSPVGAMQEMARTNHDTLVPNGGFLHGAARKRSTPCERHFAVTHMMHDTQSEHSSPERAVSAAILYMFAQLHGQAQVRDFVNVTFRQDKVTPGAGPHARGLRLAMPEVCHGVITDGRFFTFLAFQLHNLAPEFDGFENVVWTSETMKLFDDLAPEGAGPELNLECLRMLACMLNYDPRMYWPAYADDTQELMERLAAANRRVGRQAPRMLDACS